MRLIFRTIGFASVVSVLLLAQVYSHYGQDTADGGKKYGRVEFANSGAPSAQADFLNGLALLHDFEYGPAAEAFRRAEAADPGFAMAYWGEAMTYNHPIWMQQDMPAARAALAKLAPTAAERSAKAKTDREKAYLSTLEILYGDGTKEQRDFKYETAMAALHAGYPDDVDAAAFYGLAILGTAHAGRDVATYMRAARVLEEAWLDHREHPGLVHYLIHSYDDPDHAPLGLRAARIYARIAPDAGHAQHMTSHIFVALGMWPEVIDANIKAMAVVNTARAAAGKKPVTCGHYPSWLGYGYLQTGDVNKAREAVVQCRTMLDTTPDKDGHSPDPDDSIAGSFANMRLRYIIDTGRWPDEIANWTPAKNASPWTRLDFAFAQFMAAALQRDRKASAEALKTLEPVATEVVDILSKTPGPDPTFRIRPQIFLLEAKALVAEMDGDLAGAERMMTDAIALEEKIPVAFGPPMVDKPTHELFGEFLLRRGRTSEAHDQFKKAAAQTPGRRLAEKGLAASSGTAAK